jgi:aminobenzoyl-glutamate utilization protein B
MNAKYLILPFYHLSIAQETNPSANKKAVLASVEKHQQELIRLSNQIWGFAETAMKETKSSKVLLIMPKNKASE